jgi:hypothetical protein
MSHTDGTYIITQSNGIQFKIYKSAQEELWFQSYKELTESELGSAVIGFGFKMDMVKWYSPEHGNFSIYTSDFRVVPTWLEAVFYGEQYEEQ